MFPLTVVGVIAPRVKLSAPAVFVAETPFAVVTELTKVPVVGRVTVVVPVVVMVVANAPDVVNAPAVEIFPPKVIVFDPLLTPVPPFVPDKSPVTAEEDAILIAPKPKVVPPLSTRRTWFAVPVISERLLLYLQNDLQQIALMIVGILNLR